MNSIQAGTEHNLVSCGPMTDATTSFQIENGSIEEFQKLWAEFGDDHLEITFYDMGYTQLQAGIENMRNLSLFLLAAGMILTVFLLLFFGHLFITKQAGRTATERSLGMSPSQCRRSLLSGLLLLICLGSLCGGAGGALLSGNLSVSQTEAEYYDSTYSVGKTEDEEADEPQTEEEESGQSVDAEIWTAAVCVIGIVIVGTSICLLEMNRSLKREPMELLGKKQRE